MAGMVDRGRGRLLPGLGDPDQHLGPGTMTVAGVIWIAGSEDARVVVDLQVLMGNK